jgi:hypothetical protein
LGLAGLGYVVSVSFLGWEFFTVVSSVPDPTMMFLLWGPLVPFALAAIAALVAPSPRWSAVVTTIILLLLIVGACISFMAVRDEYFIFAYGLVLLGEAALSLVLLVTVSIARILLRRRLNETNAVQVVGPRCVGVDRTTARGVKVGDEKDFLPGRSTRGRR